MKSHTMGRSRWLAIGLALAAMVMVIACGGNENDSAAVQDQLAPPDQQVLRLRLLGEPKTIDPHLTNTVSETTLTKPLFAGLFTYDEDLKVVPNLATELPTVGNGGISRDGLTYTIKIDSDAKWSDGKAVTANDFVYSLKRALDPKLAGPYVSFFHGITGAKDYSTALGTAAAPKTLTDAELATLRDKVGISAKDERTVVYQLMQPNPSFLNLLALWTAFPVREDAIQAHGNLWTEAGNHISNGPFKLREWAHNERIVFEPNPYWSGEKAKLTRLQINFIADDAAAYAAYLAGEIDSTIVPPASRREVLMPGSPLNDELVRVAELTTYAVFMNNLQPPFDNVKVRQAIGLALDREAYVEGVLQQGGRTTTSWLPPGMPGHNANIGKQYEFNPAKAKQLLAEAGYPEGRGLPSITFLAVANDTNRLTGEFLEDQLRRNAGIESTTEYVDSRTYSTRLTGKDYHATLQRWAADWPYPDNWLPELFGSDGQANYTNYRNTQFDSMVERAAAETDESKRLALYDEAHRLAIDEATLMPVYNRDLFILVKPQVKNLIVTGLDGAIKGDYFFHKTYIAAQSE
jgi:oligopeptide transport system substrate-binding protein